ncbi:unnamed protein product [Dovyalis caffra]|uniref:Peptidase M14 domain-containing protein n=1 Tax=Dovyalis caffra TaxID=77055 RepID=A0AAV1S5K9_9ROSI|nr:unnamed protein product [Dovyalis caffra]
MITLKKLIKITRKRQKLAAIRRKRISFPINFGHGDAAACSSRPSKAEKGHFIVYSADGRRFVLPLAYLKNNIVGQLFKLAEEEFGLQSNGPLSLPRDASFMEYAISLVRSHVAKDVEKALLLSLATSRFINGSRISYSGSVRRRLFQDKQSKLSDDRAKGYMTNSDLEEAVNEFGQRCSNISRIYSIGKSVNGVPLWVIEISDKPGEDEPEPAFKVNDLTRLQPYARMQRVIFAYIGNVHGDEPVGRELLLCLANWICDNYMKDSLARLIVENIHLHILPSMNPDGYFLRRRGNANNIDLNRDFPDQGALVANYPWDGTEDKRRNYYACPDDKTFRFMASIYSHSHHNMSLSKEFPGGITNGALWYPIYGGMQDWNYIHAGCFELTLEISDNKWPNANELPTLWEYNKMSLLNLAASFVKVKAGRRFADYHRLLAPGERYEVMATVPGYKPKTTRISLGEAAMNLDFILDPEVTTKGSLRSINDCSCESKCGFEIFWRVHLESSKFASEAERLKEVEGEKDPSLKYNVQVDKSSKLTKQNPFIFHEMKTGGIVVCSTFVALVYTPEYSYGRSVTQPVGNIKMCRKLCSIFLTLNCSQSSIFILIDHRQIWQIHLQNTCSSVSRFLDLQTHLSCDMAIQAIDVIIHR